MHLFKYKETGPLYFRFKLNGKIYVRSSKTRNRQVAERVANQFRDSLLDPAAQLHDGTGPLKVRDGLDRYEKSKEGMASHRTLKSHIDFIKANIETGLTYDQLNNALVDRLIQKRREEVKPATVQHTLNCLRASLNHAKRLGYTVAAIDWPTISINNQRQRYLTKGEEKKLLAQLDPDRTWTKMGTDLIPAQREGLQQNYDIGIALLDTGARLNEVLHLEWKNINLEDKTVVLWRTKTKSGTTLTMTKRLYEVMSRRANDKRSDTWVFPGAGDKPAISAGARIRKAIKRAGLKNFRLHDIRHSYASKLVQNGLSLYEVASALGHSSPATSARYAHLEKRAVADKAAAVLNNLNGDK